MSISNIPTILQSILETPSINDDYFICTACGFVFTQKHLESIRIHLKEKNEVQTQKSIDFFLRRHESHKKWSPYNLTPEHKFVSMENSTKGIKTRVKMTLQPIKTSFLFYNQVNHIIKQKLELAHNEGSKKRIQFLNCLNIKCQDVFMESKERKTILEKLLTVTKIEMTEEESDQFFNLINFPVLEIYENIFYELFPGNLHYFPPHDIIGVYRYCNPKWVPHKESKQEFYKNCQQLAIEEAVHEEVNDDDLVDLITNIYHIQIIPIAKQYSENLVKT